MNEQRADIVGVWEVQAPAAPFPWHVMTFAPAGIMYQSNPPAGNRAESDSAGHGVWREVARPDGSHEIRGKFVEFKADPETGRYIGKGVVIFNLKVTGDQLDGVAQAYRYDERDAVVAGPLETPLSGRRLVAD